MKIDKYNIKLKQARKNVDLTQVEVAKKANITETSYQRIEYGLQQPSLITAMLIARALNTTVEEIFPLPVAADRGNPGKNSGKKVQSKDNKKE